jgi:hypothetical protein
MCIILLLTVASDIKRILLLYCSLLLHRYKKIKRLSIFEINMYGFIKRRIEEVTFFSDLPNILLFLFHSVQLSTVQLSCAANFGTLCCTILKLSY